MFDCFMPPPVVCAYLLGIKWY